VSLCLCREGFLANGIAALARRPRAAHTDVAGAETTIIDRSGSHPAVPIDQHAWNATAESIELSRQQQLILEMTLRYATPRQTAVAEEITEPTLNTNKQRWHPSMLRRDSANCWRCPRGGETAASFPADEAAGDRPAAVSFPGAELTANDQLCMYWLKGEISVFRSDPTGPPRLASFASATPRRSKPCPTP
jgi:hypothetical protein